MSKFKIVIASLIFLVCHSAFSAEFNGQCTTGLANNSLMQTKCDVKEIYQGKTYCFSNDAARQAFLANPDATIAKASAFYAKNAAPERSKITQEDALAQIKSKSCDMSNKDAGYLDFKGLDLSHCNLQNVSFFGSDLRDAKLIGANLQDAYLNLARIEKADFSNANLTNVTMFQPIFDHTVFKGANLTNARVIGTLGKVDMSGAIIKNGRFGLDIGNQPMGQMKFDSVGGDFKEANFEGADLNIAAFRFGDLSGANLRNTNLHRADLIGANLAGADLTGADLTDAEVDNANFSDVKGLATVKGFNTVKGKCNFCEIK